MGNAGESRRRGLCSTACSPATMRGRRCSIWTDLSPRFRSALFFAVCTTDSAMASSPALKPRRYASRTSGVQCVEQRPHDVRCSGVVWSPSSQSRTSRCSTWKPHPLHLTIGNVIVLDSSPRSHLLNASFGRLSAPRCTRWHAAGRRTCTDRQPHVLAASSRSRPASTRLRNRAPQSVPDRSSPSPFKASSALYRAPDGNASTASRSARPGHASGHGSGLRRSSAACPHKRHVPDSLRNETHAVAARATEANSG